MFKIDPTSNRIKPLQAKRFTDLGFNERQHLQEWLENLPQALVQGGGDELLIIQKEFDGFDDTRERLDLLAIDKDGNLVIVENKLDDSGRDVVWQALKYASYCASLKKQQVVDIFQRYLNQKAQREGSQPENAGKKLVEFLKDVEDLESARINTLKSQRLILVAANYRKEVTSTVLWLAQFGVQCQCFKVTPYQAGEELFLNVEQIIPTPEASDFMIGMFEKEAEERSSTNEEKSRHTLRVAFWEQALEAFSRSECTLYNSISPSKDHWLAAGSGISSMPFCLIFGKQEVRVEFSMQQSNAAANQFVFNKLFEQKEAIEQAFGHSMIWQPLPEKKACRIQYAWPVDGYDKDNWPVMIDWLIKHMTKLEATLKVPLERIKRELRTVNLETTVSPLD